MPPRPRSRSAPVVHKFGGAALADAAGMLRVLAIVRASRGPSVLVASAMAGVTDRLFAIADRAAAGDTAASAPELTLLRARHESAARAVVPRARRAAVLSAIRLSFAECAELLGGLAAVRELSPRVRDQLVARGERLSALLLAAALGRRALFVDATRVIETDGHFGNAFPDVAASARAARRVIVPLLRRGVIPVVPGFIGAARDGAITTLGRGGSDLTAVTLGRALGAREITLWKDVPGLLTADPRVVPGARVIPQLHVREAAELAYYGAKVLHPRALIPLGARRIRVFVRPFADPAAAGTEVSTRRAPGRSPVKALAAIPGQAMVTVEGNGMLGVPGIAERTFGALFAAGISVSFISQASSEHSICFAVPARDAEGAQRAVRATFRDEIAQRLIDGVRVERGLATVAVVGIGMAGTVGVAARVFGALRDAGVNVVAIAQGSSELNISVVVAERAAADAQRAIHDAFQLGKIGGGAVGERARTDLVLLGFGQIGRRVAALASRPSRDGVVLRVVGVSDRSGIVFDAGGLSAGRLRSLAAAKRRGRTLSSVGGRPLHNERAVAWAASHALHRPILVDVTAADTAPAVLAALLGGLDVVLANKQPMTGPIAQFDELRRAARERGRHVLAEATVGAGLPVLDTHAKLAESGDRVRRMDGCLSGTLGFLFDEMARGRRFSEAVRDAMARGFTEPDPRDDLSGLDVARKALTLARLLGYRGELRDIAIESLVPRAARGWPLARFLDQLETFDRAWDARVRAAAAAGRVLRYVATASRARVRVGLLAADARNPFAALGGTDNQVVFVSDRYRERPLVVSGPGAGPDVTAAGVMNDILSLARRAR